MRKYFIYTAVCMIVALVIWAGFLRGSSKSSDVLYDIGTATVERGDVARLISASGAVRALTTVEVGSQVSGQIIELLADYNSEVTKGQIVARIDPQTFESRVASAKADVASADANLEVQQANITRAEANLNQYEKDYTRQDALYKQDAIALSSLEATERQLAVARADLAVTRAQLRSSEASLSQRKASLQSARLELDRTIIRSPIDGVVIERSVDVGQTVAASFSSPVLFRIAQDLSDIRIDAAVVESDIGGINTGDLAVFKVDAYPDESFEGVVEQVRLASEELQNVVTYTVVIAAQNRGGRLLPGMTANVEITAEQRKDVLRLLETVVRFRPPNNGPKVIQVGPSHENTGNGNTGNGKSGAPNGAGNPNGGGAGFAGKLLADLDIEPARKEAIGKKIREQMQKSRPKPPSPGMPFNRNEMRQKMQAQMERVLRSELTPEEYKIVKAARDARPTHKQIDLYQMTQEGDLYIKPVSIGLSDGNYIEIIRGAKEGDIFVTKLKIVQQDQ
ncbi:MAG: secretion protein HlyD [Robiginitomaculum sp.]|nr:MAG: secretion protein HlyD [Robiginitomaculum sp.]